MTLYLEIIAFVVHLKDFLYSNIFFNSDDQCQSHEVNLLEGKHHLKIEIKVHGSRRKIHKLVASGRTEEEEEEGRRRFRRSPGDSAAVESAEIWLLPPTLSCRQWEKFFNSYCRPLVATYAPLSSLCKEDFKGDHKLRCRSCRPHCLKDGVL